LLSADSLYSLSRTWRNKSLIMKIIPIRMNMPSMIYFLFSKVFFIKIPLYCGFDCSKFITNPFKKRMPIDVLSTACGGCIREPVFTS
jgi:hypothetical protein